MAVMLSSEEAAMNALVTALIFLTAIWASCFAPVTWMHMGKPKADAGGILLGVVVPHLRLWYLGSDVLVVAIFAGSICLFVAGWTEILAPAGPSDRALALAPLALLHWRAYERRPLFYSAAIEIRERGFLYMGDFWPWDQVKSYSWTETPKLTLRLKCIRYIGTYRVNPGQKEADEALLKEKIPAPAGD